jgi:hypothetical protein
MIFSENSKHEGNLEKRIGYVYRKKKMLPTYVIIFLDTNTETGGCMYGEGLLMMSA